MSSPFIEYFQVQTSSAPFYGERRGPINLTVPKIGADPVRSTMGKVWVAGSTIDIPNDRGSHLRTRRSILTNFYALNNPTDINYVGVKLVKQTEQDRKEDFIKRIYLTNTFLEEGGIEDTNSLGTPRPLNPSQKGKVETRQDFTIMPSVMLPEAAGRVAFGSNPPGVDAPSYWDSHKAWISFVTGTIHNSSFEDHAFDYRSVFKELTLSNISNINLNNNRPFISIEPKYNFSIPPYEGSIADVTSSLLPNLYSFMSEAGSFLDINNSRFKQHIDLAGMIRDTIYQDIITVTNNYSSRQPPSFGGTSRINASKTGERDFGQHFENFANATTQTAFNSAQINQLSNAYKEIVFPSSHLAEFQNTKERETRFPMNIKLEFSTDQQSKVGEMLEKNNLFSYLINNIIFKETSIYDIEKMSYSNNRNIATAPTSSRALVDFYDAIDPTLQPRGRDFRNKLPDLNLQQDLRFLPSIVLGENNDESRKSYYPGLDPTISSTYSVFLDGIADRVEDATRSYEKILKGEKAPSETLFYSLSRKVVGQPGFEQRMWFPVTAKLDKIKYIDTQVKYNTPYRYVLIAWKLVFGNTLDYRYKEVTSERLKEIAENRLLPATPPGRGSIVEDNSTPLGSPELSTFSEPVAGTGELPARQQRTRQQRDEERRRQALASRNAAPVTSAESSPLGLGGPGSAPPSEQPVTSGGPIPLVTSPNPQFPILINPNQRAADLCLFNTTSLKLVAVPVYDSLQDFPEGIRVLDKPPIAPNVNVIPFKGVDDKIQIWLNGAVGDMMLPDIRIYDDELTERNSLTGSDGRINFKSDDAAKSFQIFRITKRPSSYQDFREMREPIIVDTIGADAASYVDTIKSNRKYYYTFRSVDVHGHTSNPSPVYEVELVQDDENVFSLINIIDLDAEPVRQKKKPGRKFIKIEPSFIQLNLNNDELSNFENLADEDVPLYVGEYDKRMSTQNVFGNDTKYKIRLTSKKNGKKIDLNVKFKINYESSTKDFSPFEIIN